MSAIKSSLDHLDHAVSHLETALTSKMDRMQQDAIANANTQLDVQALEQRLDQAIHSIEMMLKDEQ